MKSLAPALHAALALALLSPLAARAASPLPPRDFTVTLYLGTSGGDEVFLNRVVPNAGAHLGGVHVDTSQSPNRLYVFDSANNRILGFYGYRPANPDGSFPPADLVIGQPSGWDKAAANGSNTRFLPPSDRTLALLPFPYVSSTAEAPRSGMMATDAQGNLYVPDLCNNRVLKFNDPFATDCIADDVWGQTSFTNRSRPGTPTASSLNLQWEYGSTIGAFSAGVDVDAAGNLWVADSGNHRVLRFPTGAKTANLVLGQSSFTTRTSGSGLNQMNKCTGVRLHPITGELFVLDGENASNCRLMIFTPPFSNGKSAARILGKASSGSSPDGLHYARGFCFDPADTNAVWVADGGHGRILKFHTITGAMLDVIGFTNFTEVGTGNLRAWDGSLDGIHQPDGDLGFDSAGNLYCCTVGDGHGVLRFPFPLRRDASGYVIADGQMLQAGYNQLSGRTMQDHHGMTYADGRLYGASGPRLLVWTNVPSASTFQAADFVVGQSSPDTMSSSGTFNGVTLNQMSAGSNWLFGISGYRIFVFQLPFTNGGLNYPAYRVLDGGAGVVKWADDFTSVYFQPSGLAYDSVSNALWVADHDHNRLLRIANPTAATPVVDLVIGQTNKTSAAQNQGRGLYNPDTRSLAAPWSLALDRFRNLYAVDSGFEGRLDNSGNLRVLRFDAASLVPVPGNLFPNPAASGVFCKTNFTDNRNWTEANRPHTPTFVAFNSANQMVMLCDSYGNPQGQLVFWYPTPHVGLAPQPTHVITNTIGQPAIAAFDERDQLILQDHTWNRHLFYAWSNTAPLVAITNRSFVVPANASTVTLAGTNRSLAGTMVWQTSAGASGSFAAANAWSVNVPLDAAATVITVNGTNSAGVRASDSITIARQILSPPAIVPLGGSFTNFALITLSTFATNTSIRFTLDGTVPTAASPAYVAPLTLASNATLKARAIQPGVATSAVVQASITIAVATPLISPPGGSFGGSVSVTLACDTAGAEIRYTVDGAVPSTNSPRYSLPLQLEASARLQARGFKAGATPSATASASFTNTFASAATPIIEPAGGVFFGSVTAMVTCATSNAELRYTLDGREPHAASLLYTGALTITNSLNLKARAFAPGFSASAVAAATFTTFKAIQAGTLPGTGTRDRHVALGSDGTNLFFTRGNTANAGFYRLPKGATTGWTTLAPIPLSSTVNNDSGVGDLGYADGALWTLARASSGSGARRVYRYDLATNGWHKGAALAGDGPNAGVAPVAADRIFGGWIGWTRVKLITDWQAATASDVGDLSGGASHAWDSCAGPDDVYFLKHHGTAANAGVLARLSKFGTPTLAEIPGMPFNPGMGCAIEFISGALFADRHDRLYVLRGGTGSGDGDGAGWTTASTTSQLAIYDLVAQTWSLVTLPFAVDDGSEMCRVEDTLYVLAATSDAQPLNLLGFTAPSASPSAPQLQIQRAGTQALVSWPEADSDFILEAAVQLSTSDWAAVVTYTNLWLVPTTDAAGVRCFRLRSP
jgi:sugar lactone lactonase YvrE